MLKDEKHVRERVREEAWPVQVPNTKNNLFVEMLLLLCIDLLKYNYKECSIYSEQKTKRKRKNGQRNFVRQKIKKMLCYLKIHLQT